MLPETAQQFGKLDVVLVMLVTGVTLSALITWVIVRLCRRPK
jgi:hypothetical protein